MKISPIGTTILVTVAIAGTAHAHVYNYIFGMNGRAVVPPTDSDATGSGRLAYNHHTFSYSLDLFVRGVALEDLAEAGPNGTPLHIYHAPRGQTGDIALDPSYFASFVEDGDGIRLTLDETFIGGNQGAFEASMFGNHHALLDGHLYIQLFTPQYPDGEIRGQLPMYGRFLNTHESGSFVGLDGPPSTIPAPATLASLAWGLMAIRRRRESRL